MHKTYISFTRLTLPVPQGEGIVYCEFTNERNGFGTEDKEIQKYIEDSPMFKRKEILLVPQKQEEIIEPEKITLEAANWQDAADILKKEPYRIHYSKLKTPDMIKEQADLLGITFNL